MFTLAARDQYQRWEGKKDIKDDLILVGAQLPQLRAGLMVCYGVLFQSGHKVCRACSLYDSCGKEAANIGLGDVTIDPSLLNNRQTRVPFIAAGVVDDGAFHLDPKYITAYNWIRDHFTYIEEYNGSFKFKRPGVAGTNASALAITVNKKPFKIILHSVEDPALRLSEILAQVGETNNFEVDFTKADNDTIISLLTVHLQASYALNDEADSCI